MQTLIHIKQNKYFKWSICSYYVYILFPSSTSRPQYKKLLRNQDLLHGFMKSKCSYAEGTGWVWGRRDGIWNRASCSWGWLKLSMQQRMISTSCSWGWLRLYAAEDGLRLVITGVHKQQHTKSARRQGLNQCCAFSPIMENSTVPSLCSELALLALLVASTMAAVMSQLHLSSQFIDLWVLKLQKLCLASPLGPSICCRCPGYMQGLGGGPLMSHRLSPAFKIPSPVTCNKKSPDNSIPSCLTPPSSSSFLSWVPRLKGMEWIIYGVPCFKYTESSIKMDVYKPLIWGGYTVT